jgi:hypothetical protein
MKFYSDVRTLHGHALVLSELASGGGGDLFEQEMLHHQAMLRHARRRAHVLVKRLKRPNHLAVAQKFLRRRLRDLRRLARSGRRAPSERGIRQNP